MKNVRLEVLAGPGLGLLTLLVLSGFAVGPMGPRDGAGAFVELPGDGCSDVAYARGATPGPDPVCEVDRPTPGAAGLWSLLGPIALVLIGGLGLALVVALVVISRPARAVPVSAEEWWTCANCSMSNIAETPRCYNCRSWRPAQGPPATPHEATPT